MVRKRSAREEEAKGDQAEEGVGCHLRPESIRVIADCIGIPALSEDVPQALAPDVEYRMREIIQEAAKFMRHSKRSKLTTEDVNNALRLRNVEAVYGFGLANDAVGWVPVDGHPDVFHLKDSILDFDQILGAALPAPPVEVSCVPHWLAVDGIQPRLPDNPTPGSITTPPPLPHSSKHGGAGGGGAVGKLAKTPTTAPTPAEVGDPDPLTATTTEVLPPLAHVLSHELQLYFDRVSSVLLSGSSSTSNTAAAATTPSSPPSAILVQSVLQSLTSDPGLQPLMPCLTHFITHQVTLHLTDLAVLLRLMRCLRALVHNPNLTLDLYLHSLLPSCVTCLVAKRLSKSATEDHWALRDYAAATLADIAARYSARCPSLQLRLSRTLLRTLLDPLRPRPAHYGAVRGLTCLGPRVVRSLLIPNIPAYLALLESETAVMQKSDGVPANEDKEGPGSNPLQIQESQHVFTALQAAVGSVITANIEPLFTSALQRYKHPDVAASGDGVAEVAQLGADVANAVAEVEMEGDVAVVDPSTSHNEPSEVKSGKNVRVRRGKPTGIKANPRLIQARPVKSPKGMANYSSDDMASTDEDEDFKSWWMECSKVGPQISELHQVFGDILVPFISTALVGVVF